MNPLQPEILRQDIGDAEIQYLHYPGSGPVVILMHATGFLPWLWHPIARQLASQYRIIAPYFCDHRDAKPENGGLDWFILAGDLAALCNKLSIKKPYFVGHSMGATVITIANAVLHVHAEGMILIEPIILPEPVYTTGISLEQHPLASRSIKRQNGWPDMEDAKTYLKSKSMFSKWDDEMLDLYIRYGMIPDDSGGLKLACHPRREASLFMGGHQFNPWPFLPQINCRTLIVEGENSENRNFIDLPLISKLIPGCSHYMVKNAGHLIPQEQPGETCRLILDFFQGMLKM
jgi:lipase